MKVSSAPASFLDVPAAGAGSPKGGADYGAVFDSVIRDVAEDAFQQANPDKKGVKERDGKDVDHSDPKAKTKTGKPAEKGDAEKASDNGSLAADGVSADASLSASMIAAGSGQSATVEVLGRLLAGAEGVAVPAADKPQAPRTVEVGSKDAEMTKDLVSSLVEDAVAKGDLAAAGGEDALAAIRIGIEESIVAIVPDGAANPAEGDGKDAARGKVKLEVLHMETHFEPRSDAVELVEGKTSRPGGSSAKANGAFSIAEAADALEDDAAVSAQGMKLRLSFDEALQRLSARNGEWLGEGDRSDDRPIDADFDSADSLARDGAVRESRREARQDAAAGRFAEQANARETDRIEASFDRRAGGTPGTARSTGAGSPDGEGAAPLSSMTGQVAGRVIDALTGDGRSQGTADLLPGDTHLRMKAGGAALKTLSIQLQPENLGRLDVSMRLVEGQLTLELAATEADTAKVLAADREGLKKLLEHAGFSLDDASITIVTRDSGLAPLRNVPAGGETLQQDGRSLGSSGGNGSGNGEARHPRNPEERDDGRGRRAAATDEPKPRAASKTSSVYL